MPKATIRTSEGVGYRGGGPKEGLVFDRLTPSQALFAVYFVPPQSRGQVFRWERHH